MLYIKVLIHFIFGYQNCEHLKSKNDEGIIQAKAII